MKLNVRLPVDEIPILQKFSIAYTPESGQRQANYSTSADFHRVIWHGDYQNEVLNGLDWQAVPIDRATWHTNVRALQYTNSR